MKSRILIVAMLCVFAITILLTFKHVGKVKLVVMPPESLAAWYKPESKRQVWLHNMFKLRREMQAIEQYVKDEDLEKLAQWGEQFSEHYLKISEMVPEWHSRLDHDAVSALTHQIQNKLFYKIPGTLVELQVSCDSCHERYRAVSALLYRAPDFTQLSLANERPLSDTMVSLNHSVNQIKIAIDAADSALALQAFETLSTEVNSLGKLCSNCHKHTPQAYPSEPVEAALVDLETQLHGADKKAQGKALGTFAVTACAQCHGTHRISSDARQLLDKKLGFFGTLAH